MTMPGLQAGATTAAREEFAAARRRALIVGCGRRERRDDELGIRVAQELARRAVPGVMARATESPTDLLLDHDGAELLIVVDTVAASAALPRGGSLRWVIAGDPGVLRFRSSRSSHELGVVEAVRLGRDLALLPPEVWLYGIAGDDFGYGAPEPGMISRAHDLAERILADVAQWWTKAEMHHA